MGGLEEASKKRIVEVLDRQLSNGANMTRAAMSFEGNEEWDGSARRGCVSGEREVGCMSTMSIEAT